ncbi:MAG: HAMP domain-containing histidine kinase [Alphaproteobacteria bacterium]|nr:HAMP domain-containing histidine kinase [Alphaproteobacteria bacterium]
MAIRLNLSWRLLMLTIASVMVAEALILLPSLSGFRVDYLKMKLAEAHLTLTALEASSGQIDPNLRDRLLGQSGMLGMTAIRPNMPPRTLGPNMPPKIPMIYDLRGASQLGLIYDTLDVMFRATPMPMGVTGTSPADPAVVVEVVLDEGPLCDSLWDYGRRILALSIFISVMTAALVYAALQWLAVRPLRRLTVAMTAFRDDPDDPRNVIAPENRGDEFGTAEAALTDMQRRIREALLEQDRLAGVGAAVTKISHDLKNILATAMLESDRLDAAKTVDPEIKQITAGIVRAIERAVRLSTNTIKFAKEGLPNVRKSRVALGTVFADTRAAMTPFLAGATLDIPDVTDEFDVDAELVQRALENLIRNAVEAKGTEIRISMGEDGGYRALFIRDNGPGLPKKALDNLFVPFSGSARSGGSGLGLPIARELLRIQGGDILLKETSPTGTTFVMRLPA